MAIIAFNFAKIGKICEAGISMHNLLILKQIGQMATT